MLKQYLASVLFICCAAHATAQNINRLDGNIVIQKSTKIIRFVKSNAGSPVLVTSDEHNVYTATKYRTDVPVAEFYNTNEKIDDIDIRVDGKNQSTSIVTCEYFNRDGIFFSDDKICHFEMPVTKTGGRSEVRFRKTCFDPRYFTRVMFSQVFPVEEIEVTIHVPDWMQVELKEYHTVAYGLKKNTVRQENETVYTYTGRKINAVSREPLGPGISFTAPHLLVMPKTASPQGSTITYFNTLQDQYNWYAGLVSAVKNDLDKCRILADSLTKGATTDEEKAKRIFNWVQEHIRYIAFEEGIAGFQPDAAQNVLQKKYADCKGMANLLAVLLRSAKLDARLCWLGTRDIAYNYTTPSLSVDNHMICAWRKKGKHVYLDATEKYIGFGEIAERIQGRQTLMENGKTFILDTIPVASPSQNTATENRKLLIAGNDLRGHVIQVWKGESKEWLLAELHDTKREALESTIREILSAGKPEYQISNLQISNLHDNNSELKIEYDLLWKNAVSIFDKDAYLSLDNREFLKNAQIDTIQKSFAVWHHYKRHVLLETELDITGKKVLELPQAVIVREPKYTFNSAYVQEGSYLRYRSEITLNNTVLEPGEFRQWNADIQKLDKFYNQQITLQTR